MAEVTNDGCCMLDIGLFSKSSFFSLLGNSGNAHILVVLSSEVDTMYLLPEETAPIIPMVILLQLNIMQY